MKLNLNGQEVYKVAMNLKDREGRKVSRKIRCDKGGLYVIRNGLKWRIEKRISRNDFSIIVSRTLSHFEVI